MTQNDKDRIKLEKDVAEFVKNGGEIEEIESNQDSNSTEAFPNAGLGNNLF